MGPLCMSVNLPGCDTPAYRTDSGSCQTRSRLERRLLCQQLTV